MTAISSVGWGGAWRDYIQVRGPVESVSVVDNAEIKGCIKILALISFFGPLAFSCVGLVA